MRIRASTDDCETRCEQTGHRKGSPMVHASRMRSQASRFHRVASQAATCADTLQLRSAPYATTPGISEAYPAWADQQTWAQYQRARFQCAHALQAVPYRTRM